VRILTSSPKSDIDLYLGTVAATKHRSGPSEAEGVVLDLFDRFHNRLLRYVLSLGLSTHDSEEIVQEVFLSLFRHLQLGRSRKNLRGWVFRVAHNLALKQRSACQRLQDSVESNASLLERPLDPGLNPEEQVIWGQRQERLLAVLRALPEKDQHCLRLRAEGLRYREIAEILGISLGAVSISLARSLTRLGRVDER
jgi:RNA polymerase sigma-70 factor, ECF subfamily